MFEKKVLKNGLRMITVPIQGTEVVTILILVKAGSRYENKKNSGISHFTEHLFFKGTKKRPSSLAIATEIDSVGGELNAFTSKEYTGYFVKISKKYLEKALEVLADILQHSLFRPKDIEKEKPVILQEISMYEDTPIQKIGQLFEETLYNNHPLGQDVLGIKETVLNLKCQDFQNYLAKFYKANNILITLSGGLDKPEKIQRLVEKYFHFPPMKKNPVFKKIIERQIMPQVKLKNQKTEQAHLCVGVRGYNCDSPKRFVVEVISALLGGGMSSRLFEEIREKNSLAYYVKTENQTFKDCGFMYTQAGVDPKNTIKTIQIILKAMVALKDKLVPLKELEKAKEFLKGKIILEIEDSFALAELIGLQALLNKKTRTPKEIFAEIDKVSAEDIRQVAQEIFVDSKLNLAVISPKVNINSLRKILKF